jgi:hypothetical protein
MLAVAELYCRWADRSSSWTVVSPVDFSVFWVGGLRRRNPPSTEVPDAEGPTLLPTFYSLGQLGYSYDEGSWHCCIA